MGKIEGRLQLLTMENILLINTYTVNSREGLTRLIVRNYYDSIIMDTIRNNYKSYYIILIGDLNVIAEPMDYHKGVLGPYMPCMSDDERNTFTRYLELGLTDSFRHLYPQEQEYTYWSNFGNARATNKGWRLDYWLVDTRLKSKISDVKILKEYTGSDHTPVLLNIKL